MSLEDKAKTSGNEGIELQVLERTPVDGKTPEGHVSWKGINVKIPTKPYNAGGTETDYTAKKVLNTLNFYFKKAVKDDLLEALQEETEENHAHHLLNKVLIYTLNKKLIPLRAYNWFFDYRKKVHEKRKLQVLHKKT